MGEAVSQIESEGFGVVFDGLVVLLLLLIGISPVGEGGGVTLCRSILDIGSKYWTTGGLESIPLSGMGIGTNTCDWPSFA